ncbi:MAG: ATP-binding protein, partial [Desulfomicrobiaceae bacterium]
MIQLTLPAELERLGTFLEIMERFAHDLAFPPARVHKLILILEEALLNIVNHAYEEKGGEVEVRCWEKDGAITIELRDQGRPFDPLSVPEPNLSNDVKERPIGGLGVF